MKLITVLVNGRVDHIVNFDSSTPVADNYVVENEGGNIELLFFDNLRKNSNDNVIFQTDAGESTVVVGGVSLDQDEHSGSDLVDATLEVNFFPIKGEGTYDKRYEKDIQALNQKKDKNLYDKSLVKFNADPTKRYHIKVVFNLVDNIDGKGVLTKTFTINVVPRQFIHDVVLDYGSEASQLLVFNRESGKVVTINNNVPLFDVFGSALSPTTTIGDPSDYLQYDKDDNKLFRTAFLAKKTPDPIDSNGDDACKSIKDNNNVKFMTKVSELESLRNEYITIPNMKVAGHGGVEVPPIYEKGIPKHIFEYKKRFFYRSIVNSFIQQAIRMVDDSGNPAYLNIYLLMPNVYTQEDITRNLNTLSEDVMKMATLIEDFNYVKGVEVAAVSESDASFIGYMSQLSSNVKVNMENGKYLILDAGKGTLDFSVLEYSTSDTAEYAFNSVFRSGIIGAGNAITYSIVLAVLKDFYKEMWPTASEEKIRQDISSFVKEKIANKEADEAKRYQLIRNLEKYKILLNEGSLLSGTFPSAGTITSFDDLELDGINTIITSMISNRYLVKDTSDIDLMIDSLAYDAAIKLKEAYDTRKANAEIKYVIFAGRGFLMTAFKDKVLERMKSLNPTVCGGMQEKKLVEYPQKGTSATYKNLCMYVVGALSSGKYNGRIIGVPQVITKDEEGDGFTPTEEREADTPQKSWKDYISDFGDTLIRFMPMNAANRTERKPRYTSPLERNLVKGFHSYINNKGDLVVFSGIAYELPQSIREGEIDIFFDGCEFVMRQPGKSAVEHFGIISNLSAEHIFESSFPYCQVKGDAMIPFPQPRPGSDSLNDHKQDDELDEDADLVSQDDDDDNDMNSEEIEEDLMEALQTNR